jgi:cytochrome P450
MGWIKSVVLAPYNDRWRRYRRMMAQSMRKGAHERFWNTQEKVVHKYLHDLLENPEKFLDDLRLYVLFFAGSLQNFTL